MATIGYHEPPEQLTSHTRSVHRALLTVMEELEAVDWYQQRADVATDDELKAILIHNRDEEIEHAAMALEWLRRRVPKFDELLRTYLFTESPIVDIEGESPRSQKRRALTSPVAADGDLGMTELEELIIGKLDAGD
jgi:uncharacterized protein